LKKQQREESMELGKRLVEKALHAYGLHIDQLNDIVLHDMFITSRLESLNHLYEEVGIGNRPALLVAKQIAKTLGDTVKKDTSELQHSAPLVIKGTEGLVTSFARCCRPIPGDQIIGLMKVGHGIEVHLHNCPTLEKYHQQIDKYLPLSWQDGIEGDFSVDVKVALINRRGSLASLTLAISEAESNIEHIRAHEIDRHHFNVDITISVRDRIHLARILRKVRTRKDVLRIIRIRPNAETTA
jgi:guanosine-3',5'-bis(diphosphate) 3'-pyrophosphohydrolase